MAKTLRQDFPQIVIPSPVLPSREDPSEDVIALSALPTRTMDTPRLPTGAVSRQGPAGVEDSSTVGTTGQDLPGQPARGLTVTNEPVSCRAADSDSRIVDNRLIVQQHDLNPRQRLRLQQFAAIGRAAAKSTKQRAAGYAEAKPTTPDGSDEEEETEEEKGAEYEELFGSDE